MISLTVRLGCLCINQVNTVDELTDTHVTTLADVFDIKLQQKEKNLPQIFKTALRNTV